jgi:hypothetical protein
MSLNFVLNEIASLRQDVGFLTSEVSRMKDDIDFCIRNSNAHGREGVITRDQVNQLYERLQYYEQHIDNLNRIINTKK